VKIVASVKQVPDTKDQRFNEKNQVLREGLDLICNPYDEYAIEEAVRLKERFSAESWAMSMGRPSAKDLLRFAVSVGIDKAFLVSDPAIAASDLLSTALILSRALLKKGPFDVILFGKQSSDGENGVMAAAGSELLNLPFVSDIKKFVDIKNNIAMVEQMAGAGQYEIEVELPAVFSVVKEINEPRLPSLKGKISAKSAEILELSLKDLELSPDQAGSAAALTRVERIVEPAGKSGVKIFPGTPDEAVNDLVQELLSKKLL
jgi:electron transfer flavoprotein beta subunit